ncbi:MAG: tRNA uridine-5-carboxymethylaminomethyl(34) synthesis GTPase MnmE [Paludibacteraceae bacterium]
MHTIAAISTPAGTGGIAVVRVSGNDALSLVDRLFRGKHALSEARGYSVHYGELRSGEEVIDEVLCTVFRAPHSFTGEDTVEIACHGSVYIQQAVMQALIEAGVRMAGPGEFTQRAFLNGKMDLTQAEAVADLIAAQSQAEKNLALQHLKGGISDAIQQLRDQLLHFTSLIELELDFADHEELEFADRSELRQLAEKIAQHLNELISSFRVGNAIKNGIPVAIVGATNAGKSTLLNALLGEEKAIVSDIHGTTRDLIEDTLIIDGIQFRFIDTAGLRSTHDTIEEIGIQRTLSAARRAEIVLYVSALDEHFPQGKPLPESLGNSSGEPMAENPQGLSSSGEPHSLLHEMGLDDIEEKLVRVYNKADLLPPSAPLPHDGICISALSGNLTELKKAIVKAAGVEQQSGTIISQARHYDALVRAHEAIQRVMQGLNSGISGEFLSMDLQDCLHALGEITGQISNDEVLGNIFSKFCIGK